MRNNEQSILYIYILKNKKSTKKGKNNFYLNSEITFRSVTTTVSSVSWVFGDSDDVVTVFVTTISSVVVTIGATDDVSSVSLCLVCKFKI